MNMFKSNGGFTLVELIVVIAILAILAGVAVPVYSTYITNANNSVVENTLDNLSNAAILANAKAGGITKIEVKNDGTVTITADSFDKDFDTTLPATLKGLTVDTTKNTTTTRTCKITAPTAWASSKYKTNETLTWENNKWPWNV